MLTIILPVYNQFDAVQRYFDCLAEQPKDIQVIMIDCGDDETYKRLHTKIKRITIIALNKYWAKSLQLAYNYIVKSRLQTDYVMIGNVDITFHPFFINHAVGSVRQGQLLTTHISDECHQIDGAIKIDWSKYQFSLNKVSPNCASTRALFMTYEDYLKIGRMRPRLLPHYLSDYDMTYRAYRAGLTIREYPNLVAYSTDQQPDKVINRPIFGIKNPANPIYHTIFILLHCPLRYKLINILRVWYNVMRMRCVKY
jgi:hypothetical protein